MTDLRFSNKVTKFGEKIKSLKIRAQEQPNPETNASDLTTTPFDKTKIMTYPLRKNQNPIKRFKKGITLFDRVKVSTFKEKNNIEKSNCSGEKNKVLIGLI